MKLIDEMENNVDALVVDSEIAFQVLDQTRSSNVGIGKARFDIDLSRNEPLLLDPEFQRRCVDARRGQKFLLAHDHDRLAFARIEFFALGPARHERPRALDPATSVRRPSASRARHRSPHRDEAHPFL